MDITYIRKHSVEHVAISLVCFPNFFQLCSMLKMFPRQPSFDTYNYLYTCVFHRSFSYIESVGHTQVTASMSLTVS